MELEPDDRLNTSLSMPQPQTNVPPARQTTAADGLAYPFTEVPPEGEIRAVAAGIYWVRMPLPLALDHINLWLIDDGPEGWSVIDAGFSTARTKRLWERIFGANLADRPVTRVFCTHFHPDHIGLSGWLVDRWAAQFWIPRTEWLMAHHLLREDPEQTYGMLRAFYRQLDTPEDLENEIGERNHGYQRVVKEVPDVFHRLFDGQDLSMAGRSWRVLTGRGHAPEMAMFYDDTGPLLIAADQVLPRISPNVSILPYEPFADPLSDFLETLDGLKALPRETLVLPSHGKPFYGLHERICQLEDHHAARLDEMLEAGRDTITAFEATLAMFRRDLDGTQIFFALGEALAHLNHLVAAGRMTRRVTADGIWRFKTV